MNVVTTTDLFEKALGMSGGWGVSRVILNNDKSLDVRINYNEDRIPCPICYGESTPESQGTEKVVYDDLIQTRVVLRIPKLYAECKLHGKNLVKIPWIANSGRGGWIAKEKIEAMAKTMAARLTVNRNSEFSPKIQKKLETFTSESNIIEFLRRSARVGAFDKYEKTEAKIFDIAASVSIAATVMLLLVGFLKIIIFGPYRFVLESSHLFGYHFGNGGVGGHETIEHFIQGVEFIFLAPIPYFVIRSLSRFFQDYMWFGYTRETTRISLLSVKALVVGLLWSMVVASLAGEAIRGEADLKVEKIIITIVLGVSFFYIEHVVNMARAALRKEREKENHHRDMDSSLASRNSSLSATQGVAAPPRHTLKRHC